MEQELDVIHDVYIEWIDQERTKLDDRRTAHHQKHPQLNVFWRFVMRSAAADRLPS